MYFHQVNSRSKRSVILICRWHHMKTSPLLLVPYHWTNWRAPLIATAPSSHAVTDDRLPRKLPKGVRAAPTMTTSWGCFPCGRSLSAELKVRGRKLPDWDTIPSSRHREIRFPEVQYVQVLANICKGAHKDPAIGMLPKYLFVLLYAESSSGIIGLSVQLFRCSAPAAGEKCTA